MSNLAGCPSATTPPPVSSQAALAPFVDVATDIAVYCFFPLSLVLFCYVIGFRFLWTLIRFYMDVSADKASRKRMDLLEQISTDREYSKRLPWLWGLDQLKERWGEGLSGVIKPNVENQMVLNGSVEENAGDNAKPVEGNKLDIQPGAANQNLVCQSEDSGKAKGTDIKVGFWSSTHNVQDQQKAIPLWLIRWTEGEAPSTVFDHALEVSMELRKSSVNHVLASGTSCPIKRPDEYCGFLDSWAPNATDSFANLRLSAGTKAGSAKSSNIFIRAFVKPILQVKRRLLNTQPNQFYPGEFGEVYGRTVTRWKTTVRFEPGRRLCGVMLMLRKPHVWAPHAEFDVVITDVKKVEDDNGNRISGSASENTASNNSTYSLHPFRSKLMMHISLSCRWPLTHWYDIEANNWLVLAWAFFQENFIKYIYPFHNSFLLFIYPTLMSLSETLYGVLGGLMISIVSSGPDYFRRQLGVNLDPMNLLKNCDTVADFGNIDCSELPLQCHQELGLLFLGTFLVKLLCRYLKYYNRGIVPWEQGRSRLTHALTVKFLSFSGVTKKKFAAPRFLARVRSIESSVWEVIRWMLQIQHLFNKLLWSGFMLYLFCQSLTKESDSPDGAGERYYYGDTVSTSTATFSIFWITFCLNIVVIVGTQEGSLGYVSVRWITGEWYALLCSGVQPFKKRHYDQSIENFRKGQQPGSRSRGRLPVTSTQVTGAAAAAAVHPESDQLTPDLHTHSHLHGHAFKHDSEKTSKLMVDIVEAQDFNGTPEAGPAVSQARRRSTRKSIAPPVGVDQESVTIPVGLLDHGRKYASYADYPFSDNKQEAALGVRYPKTRKPHDYVWEHATASRFGVDHKFPSNSIRYEDTHEPLWEPGVWRRFLSGIQQVHTYRVAAFLDGHWRHFDLTTLIELNSTIGLFLTFWLIGARTALGEITVGQFTFFIGFLGTLNGLLDKIAACGADLPNYIYNLILCKDLLDRPDERALERRRQHALTMLNWAKVYNREVTGTGPSKDTQKRIGVLSRLQEKKPTGDPYAVWNALNFYPALHDELIKSRVSLLQARLSGLGFSKEKISVMRQTVREKLNSVLHREKASVGTTLGKGRFGTSGLLQMMARGRGKTSDSKKVAAKDASDSELESTEESDEDEAAQAAFEAKVANKQSRSDHPSRRRSVFAANFGDLHAHVAQNVDHPEDNEARALAALLHEVEYFKNKSQAGEGESANLVEKTATQEGGGSGAPRLNKLGISGTSGNLCEALARGAGEVPLFGSLGEYEAVLLDKDADLDTVDGCSYDAYLFLTSKLCEVSTVIGTIKALKYDKDANGNPSDSAEGRDKRLLTSLLDMERSFVDYCVPKLELDHYNPAAPQSMDLFYNITDEPLRPSSTGTRRTTAELETHFMKQPDLSRAYFSHLVTTHSARDGFLSWWRRMLWMWMYGDKIDDEAPETTRRRVLRKVLNMGGPDPFKFSDEEGPGAGLRKQRKVMLPRDWFLTYSQEFEKKRAEEKVKID